MAHLFTGGHFFHTLSMKYKTLLIDLDGTILGTHPILLQILFIFHFISCLREHRFPWWRGLAILHRLKHSMRETTHQKNGTFNWIKATVYFSQLSGRSLEESEKILTETSLKVFERARASLFAVHEAKEFIAWAKERYQLILATNPLWPLEVVLFRMGIAEIKHEHFEFITHAGNMSAIKPHLGYYQELQTLKTLDPSTCLMIGNDEVKDGPARQIGIDVFIIKKPSDFLKLKNILEKAQ